jgi:hypothetical protein
MLMPGLSVTAIGIAVAVVAIIRGMPATGALLRGLVGGWLGFLVGAVPGVLLDVLLADGVYVAVLGHLGAAGGAAVAVVRAPAPTPAPTANLDATAGREQPRE